MFPFTFAILEKIQYGITLTLAIPCGSIFKLFSFVYGFSFCFLLFSFTFAIFEKSKMGSLLPLYYILLSIPLCAGFPFVFLCLSILDFLKNPIWKIKNEGRGGLGSVCSDPPPPPALLTSLRLQIFELREGCLWGCNMTKSGVRV